MGGCTPECAYNSCSKFCLFIPRLCEGFTTNVLNCLHYDKDEGELNTVLLDFGVCFLINLLSNTAFIFECKVKMEELGTEQKYATIVMINCLIFIMIIESCF